MVEALARHGVDTIFGVPGESVLPVLEALRQRQGEMRFITCRHEASACQMADADAKLSGKPGVVMVSRGPGAMHGAIGLHTAFQDSTPLLMIVGQVPSAHRGREAFQEMDFAAIFAPMTKWAAEIPSAAQMPEYFRRALCIAQAGRPGPVVLSVPEDLLDEVTDAVDLQPQDRAEPAVATASLVALREALEVAKRPLVVVGGSGWTQEAGDAVTDFIVSNGLPVAAAFRSQDIIDNRLDNYIGDLSLGQNPALTHTVGESDFILVIGDRFGDVPTRGYTSVKAPNPDAVLAHVYPEPAELGRIFCTDIPIVASPSGFAGALAGFKPVASSSWVDWRRNARNQYLTFHVPGPANAGLDMAQVVRQLRQRLPEDAIITNGAGNYNIWLHRYFSYYRLGTQIAPKSGTMGYGVPAAIAAKLRYPHRTVVALAGDGCFSMAIPELATAIQHELAVIILIVNNSQYGSIRMHQERRFPGRPFATTLENPDFVALARSYGAYAQRIETHAVFPDALEDALSANRLAIIELATDPGRLTPDFSL